MQMAYSLQVICISIIKFVSLPLFLVWLVREKFILSWKVGGKVSENEFCRGVGTANWGPLTVKLGPLRALLHHAVKHLKHKYAHYSYEKMAK